ncbi:MAG: HigA family addiction module antitoxin [Thermodesulfobacteriota bacterium]|nr:HigA family addiction module antitoxin [Thermodesulfobacteriota bacterium]
MEHPGIILKEEFMEPLGTTAYTVSKGSGIPQTAIGEILKGKRTISSINTLNLSKFFCVSETFFLSIQSRYDLDLAKEKARKPLSKIIFFKRPDLNKENLLDA